MAEGVRQPRSMVEQPWKLLAYTGVFCLAIGLFFGWRNGFQHLTANLVVSFAIGLSISLSFILFSAASHKVMSPYIVPIPLTAFGLGVGLLIGGTYVSGNPLFFFTQNNGTLLTGIFFGIVGFAIFGTRARLLSINAALVDAEAQRERQEKLLMQTELRLLQAQIEPHFLFNTLSNIAGLIHRDPDAAEHTLLNLTTLLRATLNRTREAVTTLAEEIAIARAYLEIQKTRMQSRLRYDIIWDESLGPLPLPPLLVQPLVENAIKHGLEPTEEGGEVVIEVDAHADALVISVKDTGQGIHEQGSTGSGTGLTNVRERLRTLYDGSARLDLAENSPQGMIATITLPRSPEPPPP